MQVQATSAAVCPECGTRLEGGFSRGLGRCMICLLRVGFDDAEEPDETLLAPVADRLGNYRIERRDDGSLWELGRGAMGVTYRAVDTSLRRAVALKLIDSEWAKRGAEARERFMREARTAASLRHPNVATVYHFGIREENGQCFCAMELVEGETLEMRVRRTGPLDALTTIDIALQVSSALAAAEKQGLVHRDLKPANLMLVAEAPDANDSSPSKAEKADTVVKVIDFGVAKALVEKPDAMGLTHGGFVGTPAFASPEQFTDARVDVRSDIYSLGATLWYLLAGHRPFEGATIEQIRASQHSQALPIEQLKAARVPSQLVSLLVSMLAPEPAARPGVRALTLQLQDCRAQILDRWKAARRLALAAGLIGIAVAAFVLFPRWHNRAMSQNTAPANISEKSIAVLPFDNLSDDQANAYFAVGIQDEILTSLARVADLKVISRTSIMQYTAGPRRNLREIGKELGVAHLLEGSVQRDAKRVRVNAQLIDARTDAHLWAQTYDRDLADVFAIQSEIAKAIADQLQAKLSPNEKKAIEQPPTRDLAAFDLYSHAKSLLLTAGISMTGEPDLRKAIELLDEAVKRDPSFFDAYCQLAWAHEWLYAVGGFDHTPARLALAEAALQAATRLRPDAAETHLARAEYLYYGLRDYAGALAELEIARRALPNDPRLFELTGYILQRRGQQEEGLQNLQRAVELDPRNFSTLQQIAMSYEELWRYAETIAALDRSLAILPDNVETRANRAEIELYWKADTRPLHQTIDAILAQGSSAIASVAGSWFDCALAERDPAAAERALVALGDNPCWGDSTIYLSRSFGEGLLARLTKDEARARTAFEAARAQQEKIVQAQPDYGPALCVLGLIDAALGRKDLALDEGRRAIALTPMEKDVCNGSRVLQYFAITAAWAGEKELALQQLEAGLRAPSAAVKVLSYGALKLLPVWDPLRGDPRFEKIVASLAPK
jgi:serine/threonine protein kinase/Tfp pilus assembly protein PilF